MALAPKTDRPASRDFSQLAALARFLRPYKGRLAAALVSLIVAAGAVLTIGQAVRGVIDRGFAGADPLMLDNYFLMLLGVIVVLAAATFARFYFVSWLGERVVADVRRAVYAHVLKLSPAWFETTKTGEVLSRLTADTETIQSLVGSTASVAARNALLFLGGAALMLVSSLQLTLMVALVIPVVLIPILVFGRKVRSLSRASLDRIADASAMAGETLNAIPTVQAYTHEARDIERFGAASERAFVAAIARIRARAWLTALVMLLVFGAVDAVMWYGGKSVFAGTMSAGELTAFVFYAVISAAAVGALSESWGDIQRAAGAAERLGELLSTEPQIRAPAAPLALPVPAQGDLRLDGVTFRYPTRPERPALDAIDLHVQPGETVALVGPSGAGKTTLFQLLLRFYDADQGTITLDGVPIAAADPAELRRRIAFVSQEPVLFSATVRENIAYGKPEATDDEIRAAADAAAASGFIAALPQGYDTFVGERGVRLSGGQRQRIAIARALLRDAPLLLLDEATSALDAESERKVQQALERLMHNRTTIVIAHRLATVRRANRIVVLDQGRVVASGTHGQLVEQDGLYARLARLQFLAGGRELAEAG